MRIAALLSRSKENTKGHGPLKFFPSGFPEMEDTVNQGVEQTVRHSKEEESRVDFLTGYLLKSHKKFASVQPMIMCPFQFHILYCGHCGIVDFL
jgi:hypothetical protein